MEIDKPFASSSTTALSYLEHQEAQSSPAIKNWFTKIRTQYERKLWHNLTVTLLAFVFSPDTGSYQIDLYEKFITTLEGKVNTLRLVEIARRVGREYSGRLSPSANVACAKIPEPDLTLAFLRSVHSRLPSPYPTPATETTPAIPAPSRPIPEAYCLSLSSIAYAQLLLGDLPSCKKTLNECEKLLGEQDTVEPIVNAGFYGVAGDYHKVKAEYGPYFKNSLLYLACIDVDTELEATDRVARAHDLCIAALLGETIYNFGELLQHPILQCLVGTEHDWIKSLISAFNAGEIGKFESLSNNFANEPILEASLPFLRQKICLMALIQTAFSRPRDGASRLMTFQQIAQSTRLPVHEVEHLIMKALSLSLIRGSLDQVSSTVDITWVQPRVLEGSQLDTLASQFKAWTSSVGKTEESVDQLRAEARQLVAAS